MLDHPPARRRSGHMHMTTTPASAAERKRTLKRQGARERRRRYRARKRAARMVAWVELGDAELDFLVGLRWLAEVDAADARKTGAAISAMLADAAAHR